VSYGDWEFKLKRILADKLGKTVEEVVRGYKGDGGWEEEDKDHQLHKESKHPRALQT